MENVLWRGSWTTRIRIVSGLVLMIYVTMHLINIGAELYSPSFANAFQEVRLMITRSNFGKVVISSALIAHLMLSIYKVSMRRSLKMPFVDGVQIAFGLSIPLILSSHVIYTQIAFQSLAVDTKLGYVSALIWNTTDGWLQVVLMVITWIHGIIGIHMWLRMTSWWSRHIPWLVSVSVLIPTFALLGFVSSGRAVDQLMQDDTARKAAFKEWNFPDNQDFSFLRTIDTQTDLIIWSILATLAMFILIRSVVASIQKPVRITYVNGPTVRAARGPTLLETSQATGVGHTALCGGRGRCTTCRIIVEDGLEDLPPPSASELRALNALGAPNNTRLACQVRPQGDTNVFRVFQKNGNRGRAPASQGKEAQLAVLFLDIRSFTARTDGQLPYDIVFLLNRFFDEIVPPILAANGTIDKYMGDGLMAVFETKDKSSSARSAIRAVKGVGSALLKFNKTLRTEGSAPIKIGIGVHLGTVVLGEIGAAGKAPRTLIGDTVNIASRLESHTKTNGVQALISLDTLDAAEFWAPDDYVVSLNLRGREAPLKALQLIDASNTEIIQARSY